MGIEGEEKGECREIEGKKIGECRKCPKTKRKSQGKISSSSKDA